jgi:alkylated DNA repair dioxygenase AlkB
MVELSLFSGDCQSLEGPGLRVRLWPGWLDGMEARSLQDLLQRQVPWKQEAIRIFGRSQAMPRLTCWMADPGCHYCYSGLSQRIEPWNPAVLALIERLQHLCGWRFNAVLLNLYRDGRDSMGWHADNEPELEAAAPIASLSLGASRSFRLRPASDLACTAEAPRQLELAHGDLLLMDPPTQQHWQHSLPRRLRVLQPRINLTFRVVRRPS